MSHFYGYVQGNRSEATRGGSRKSGYTAVAASWQGCVVVSLWYDESTKTDMATVSLGTWQGRGINKTLYSGPVNGKTMGEPDEQ